ncbi:hypothetical protein [Pseudomonas violetae]|jgi:hypothetical protein|uniref:Uncharacterized protein n=1 Tax=Pseudomonas violetae TaxID=2915813 RepID=A0ABT0F0C9_9PSED|nr:hypothetical protein [Pseudomonas violetae]MCK1791449.1 hypothetical protein [Pseudomonas violetae]
MTDSSPLPPPTIVSPKQAEEVEKLLLQGTGTPGAFIEFNFSFWSADKWQAGTEVKQDGTWSFTPEGAGLDKPGDVWIRVRQMKHWPAETSLPSETIHYRQLLAPPVIKKPLEGESLPLIEQTIEGTAFYGSSLVDIELIKVSPLPTGTYKTSIKPDGGGFWKANPNWALTAGSYVLKARQTHTDSHGVTHVSNWTKDLPILAG